MAQAKFKLGLNLPSDPRWVRIAEMNIGDILADHAYCEQKAASSCISLIVQYSDYPELIEQLSPVVTEEWGHFRSVIAELKKRGLELGPPRRDEYVNGLLGFQRKSGSRKEDLLEKLLTMALIEARSCERFRLLSISLSDDSLKQFYHGFMLSEAQHYRMFIKLAERYFDSIRVRKRWSEYLKYEAELMQTLEVRSDRFH